MLIVQVFKVYIHFANTNIVEPKRSSDDIDIIYIRNEISKAVKVVLNPIDCLIWLTIDKHISILSRKCILVVFI